MKRLALAVLPLFALPVPQDEAKTPDPFVAFAERLEQTIADYDPSFLDDNFDLDAYFDRVTKGVDAPAGFGADFERGFRDSFSFGISIVQNNAQFDGMYHFLHMRPGDEKRAIFRHAGDDGLNYQELLLEQDDEGRVHITDIFLHASGEWLTETTRRVYVSIASTVDKSLAARLFGEDSDLVDALLSIDTLLERAQTDPEGALAKLDSFSEETLSQKHFQFLRLQIAANLADEDAYVAALEQYRSRYPDAPELLLIMLDHHILAGEIEQCMQSLAKIEEIVLGDAYLDVMRSMVWLEDGAFAKARTAANRAVERDPRLEYAALWPLLTIALAEEDHDATLALLIRLADDWGIEFEDLGAFPEYAAFVPTKQHEAWLEHLEGE